MKTYLLTILLAMPFWPLLLCAQSLPDNYIIEEGGTFIRRYQQQSGNGFYGEDTVRTIALTFADTSWWSQIDDSVGYAQLQYGDLMPFDH